jgi:hypothetical protein
LLFSDIGSPVIRLLPLDTASPERSFLKLRKWIDVYYEINGAQIAYWRQAEEEIRSLCQRIETPIIEINSWQYRKRSDWISLKKLSAYYLQIRNSTPDSALLSRITSDYDLPSKVREVISPYAAKLKSVEQRLANLKSMETQFEALSENRSDRQHIANSLKGLREKIGPDEPDWFRSELLDTIEAFAELRPPRSPFAELYSWWRYDGRPLSRNVYKKNRRDWASYSIAKYGDGAVENVADILRREWEAVENAASCQGVNALPAESAEAVILAIAEHLGILGLEGNWRPKFQNYYEILVEYFAKLQRTAPLWLKPTELNGDGNLAWKDCIPSVGHRQSSRVSDWLGNLPKLTTLVSTIEPESKQLEERRVTVQRAEQSARLDRFLADSRRWLAASSTVQSDHAAVWEAATAAIVQIQKEAEEKIIENSKRLLSAPFSRNSYSAEEVVQMMRKLDEYELAVRSLKLPFDSDNEVLRINPNVPLVEAADLRSDCSDPPSKLARHQITDAITKAEGSIKKWSSFQREASEWTPGGALYRALAEVLAPDRLEELFGVPGPSDNVVDFYAKSDRAKILKLLDALDVGELTSLERILSKSETPPQRSKKDIFSVILAALGVGSVTYQSYSANDGFSSSDIEETLRVKMNQGAFDIFLAHNSNDKPLALELADQLRSRGIYPWIDVEQIPPGRWFQDVIQSVIRVVKAAAILLGPSGLGRWQIVELRSFVDQCLDKGIPLIPVLLPGVSNVPEHLVFLRQLKFVKVTNNISDKEILDELEWGITGKRVV